MAPNPRHGNRSPSGVPSPPPPSLREPTHRATPSSALFRNREVFKWVRGCCSRVPLFLRWSEPGASSQHETLDYLWPTDDPLTSQGQKPWCSLLRHVEVDGLPSRRYASRYLRLRSGHRLSCLVRMSAPRTDF